MFSNTARRLLQYVGGKKLTDLPEQWQRSVSKVLSEEETADPRITQAEIRGSQPHQSYDDLEDKQEVISVRLLDEEDKRIASIHVHKDGTSKKVTLR